MGNYQLKLPYILYVLIDIIYVNPNTTLPKDETISHKKCTIDAIKCIFGRLGLQVVPHQGFNFYEKLPHLMAKSYLDPHVRVTSFCLT